MTRPSTQYRRDKQQPTDLSGYVFGKLQPQALPLEEAVLGAIMIDRDALVQVADFLKADHFYTEKHQAIYEACLSLFNQSEPIDILTVAEQLKKTGQLDFVGGSYYLVELSSRVASSANIEYHSRIIQEKWIARQVINVASRAVSKGYEETTDAFDLLEEVETELFNVGQSQVGGIIQTAESLAAQVVRSAIDARSSENHITGVTTGFRSIDRQTGGLQRGDLIVIAARPGMGKTSLVMNIATASAKAAGSKVLVFSLEMPADRLMARIISAEAKIPVQRLLNGQITDGDQIRLERLVPEVGGLSVAIDDTPALSVSDLRRRAKRHMRKAGGLDMIVVDYIQLMSGGTDEKRGQNREQVIAAISRGLKLVAKELNVPVIALSQLSRAVEARGGSKRPQLSDLRESGAIEQDCDIVGFIYRPEYYKIMEDETGKSLVGKAELDFAKFRNGKPGVVLLDFNDELTLFSDPAPADPFTQSINTQFVSDYAVANSHRREPDEDTPF